MGWLSLMNLARVKFYFYGRGEIDPAPRSSCGLREKTPLNFPQKGDGPKSQKGVPDPRRDPRRSLGSCPRHRNECILSGKDWVGIEKFHRGL